MEVADATIVRMDGVVLVTRPSGLPLSADEARWLAGVPDAEVVRDGGAWVELLVREPVAA